MRIHRPMPTANRMRPMTLATVALIVVRQPHPVNTGRILPAADEMTAGHHLRRPVTAGNRHGADAMIAGPGISTSVSQRRRSTGRQSKWLRPYPSRATTPRCRVISSAQRLVRVHVHRHAERAHETGTFPVTTTTEKIIQGTDTGTVDVDEDVYSLRLSASRVRVVPFCLICLSPYS